MVQTLPEDAVRRLRRYRHDRLVEMMVALDVPALLLYDPVNIRYATDSRNVQVYALNHDARYCFIAHDGYTELFDWVAGDVHHGHLDTIDAVRTARPVGFMSDGDENYDATLRLWAAEIAALVRRASPDDMRLGIDRLSPFQAQALAAEGVTVVNGQPAVYRARSIKSADEIAAIRISADACDEGFRRMWEATRPGVTESEIWALLHQTNIEWEGEWINARYLLSGQKTNPWAQETGLRVIEKGDVVGCDSDLIGPHGYAFDISRTWICDAEPTDRQRRLYAKAHEHVHQNLDRLRPGATFMELADGAFFYERELAAQNFTTLAHGLGLENEWPIIMSGDKTGVVGAYGGGYDGVVEPGMVLCVESYAGEVGGPDGIKLEEQVLITETGCEVLSKTPYQEAWL
jgi:Xaa-Pro dipeptidase